MSSIKTAVIYIHGQFGNAAEAEHYNALFPDADVIGYDYDAAFPWEAIAEFPPYFDKLLQDYDNCILVANSIGAYFALCALSGFSFSRVFFISPVVDMERLILDMMRMEGVSEEELQDKGEIPTSSGETLSWDYLSWVRAHPVTWNSPTSILFGENDLLQTEETVSAFAERFHADLTVMTNGEHWFHTEEQMAFLDCWILG